MDDSWKSELLRSFIEDFTDLAIVAFDTDGRIMTWNAGAQAILGYASAEIVGRHSSDLLSKEGVPAVNSGIPLDDAMTWGRHETTLRLVDKQGAELDAQVVLKPVRDSQKNLIGFGMLAIGVGMFSESVTRSTDEVADNTEREPYKIVSLRGAKILLVDDDDLVREQIEDQLTNLGYQVIASSKGTEALEILGRVSDIDLLFTDVVMPNGIGGRELAVIARQLRPDLKVLFTSGYFQDALVNRGELALGVECLVKPYRRTQLVQTLDRLLKPNI
ncbi:MAG: response regulator [Planctomycetota bacterium]